MTDQVDEPTVMTIQDNHNGTYDVTIDGQTVTLKRLMNGHRAVCQLFYTAKAAHGCYCNGSWSNK